MANEISKILRSDEKTLWAGSPARAPYLVSQVLFVALFSILLIVFLSANFIAVALGGLLLLYAAWQVIAYPFVWYAVTDQRVVFQSGVFGRDFRSIPLSRIQNVQVDVNFYDQLFGVGNLSFFSGELESVRTGKYGSSLQPKRDSFLWIPNAYDVARLLETKR